MRTLVVGAGGLVGSNVVRAAQNMDWTVIGTYHSKSPSFDIPLEEFDLTTPEQFTNILDDADPEVVVNCAALTDVDKCEEAPTQARLVNGTAPGLLAKYCADRDVRFVHTSTDYVFDGKSETPYEESASPNPLQEYGKSKFNGEQTVLSASNEAVIARLSFVYGIHRSTGKLTGFPSWVANRVEAEESIPLFTDQRVTPSRAGQTAQTLLECGATEMSGLFHVVSRSCVTPYEFGHSICEVMNGDATLLEQGSRTDVDRAATRPQDTCLSVTKLEESLGREQPTVEDDLQAIQTAF